MADTNETIADIIAEMRNRAKRPDFVSQDVLKSCADRLDAAWKRAHEALEFIAHYDDDEEQMDDPYCGDGHILVGKAKEALGIKEQEGGAK